MISMGPKGHPGWAQAGKGARITGKGDETHGACQGTWAKYPKKLLEGGARHTWGIWTPQDVTCRVVVPPSPCPQGATGGSRA